MAKALYGTYATPRTLALLDEIRALRTRVAELENALAQADDVRDSRSSDTVQVVEQEPVKA